MSETFTNRYIEHQEVARIEHNRSGDGGAITGTGGLTAGCSGRVLARLAVGSRYGVETRGGPFGTICGWLIDGDWIDRKSDQQLDREHAEMVAGFERERRERLATMRGEWIGREEMLPGWLKERIHVFHERGGEKFEVDGWGYELTVCELAALYEKHGYPAIGRETPYEELPQEIRDYDHAQGCSGNQHDMARALVKHHQQGESLAGTVSALSPLTGDAFYAD